MTVAELVMAYESWSNAARGLTLVGAAEVGGVVLVVFDAVSAYSGVAGAEWHERCWAVANSDDVPIGDTPGIPPRAGGIVYSEKILRPETT
jgi:hypothetical protein